MASSIRSNRLRRLREADGLSRAELATRVSSPYGNRRRVHERTIDRWERGTIPERHWHELATIFGVSVAYLLGLDRGPTDERDSA